MLRTVALWLSLCATAHAAPIMAWGFPTTPQGKTPEIRIHCAAPPTECIKAAERADMAGVHTLAISIAIHGDRAIAIERAKQYAQLRASYPILRELGIDDFASYLRRIPVQEAPQFLHELADTIRAGGFAFGVTIYESELDEISTSQRLPADVRLKVDRVAFFLHHRQSVASYESELARVKQLFPRARVYAGLYHYDRRDYMPCVGKGAKACSEEEEFARFNESAQAAERLLKAGAVDGIELYPGRLGAENTWSVWNYPNTCRQNRMVDCINTSRRMSAVVERLIDRLMRETIPRRPA